MHCHITEQGKTWASLGFFSMKLAEVDSIWRAHSHCRPKLQKSSSFYVMWRQGCKSLMLFRTDVTDLVKSCNHFVEAAIESLCLSFSTCIHLPEVPDQGSPPSCLQMASVCKSLWQIEALPSQCWHISNTGQPVPARTRETRWTLISFAGEMLFNSDGRWHHKTILPSVFI